MTSALIVRTQIEAALAHKIPSALTPKPRMARPVVSTGVAAVDELIEGGLPVGALTEMVGAECSGRTALALTFVAQVTRAEKVCAWVDVSDALSPESAAECGVDLTRMLWVRCGVLRQEVATPVVRTVDRHENGFQVPTKYFVPKPVVRGLHGGGMGGHPRDEAKGMGSAVSGLFHPSVMLRNTELQRRGQQQRMPAEPSQLSVGVQSKQGTVSLIRKPWERIEQALKTTDLLLQAGGFGAIVLDMGGLGAEHVSRIPLATWFRYRAGSERTQACVVLLTQHACAKSAAGLVLLIRSGEVVTMGDTVLAGFERHVEVVRQRFVDEEKFVSIRKPPQRVGGAMWQSGTVWAGAIKGMR